MGTVTESAAATLTVSASAIPDVTATASVIVFGHSRSFAVTLESCPYPVRHCADRTTVAGVVAWASGWLLLGVKVPRLSLIHISEPTRPY